MRKKAGLVLLFLGALVSSTSVIMYFWLSLEDPNSNELGITEWDNYTEPGIFTALEEVEIENINFSLETYMWRDFMPISPPDGKPLIVIINIHAIGVVVFPSTLNLERIWLIYGTDVISALPTNEYSVDGNVFKMVFRDGPKWGPGIVIDVVVKLRSVDFNYYYLLALNQPIYRTD